MRFQSNYAWLATLALGTILHPSAAIGQSPKSERIPSAVEECEERGKARLCSTWKWNGKEFDATWSDGSTGKLTIGFVESNAIVLFPGVSYTETHVTFTRVDYTGSTAGFSALYQCQVHHGKVVNGWYSWVAQGISRLERWSGTFTYGPVNDQRTFISPVPVSPPLEAAPPHSESITPPSSSTNSGLTLKTVGDKIAELDSTARELSAQWAQFQQDCPEPTADELCLDDKRQVTLAVIENTKSRIQFIDERISLLDAGQQDVATQQVEDVSAKKRGDLKAALRRSQEVLANLNKSLTELKRMKEDH